MRFIDFVNESVVTKRGVFLLSEGITHIEDLPPEEFIRAVRNMSKMIATEKLDGANLTFGFDSRGKFYTSREAKGGSDRFYSSEDYTNRAADNGFKAAHAALEKVAPKLRKIVNPGEAVEIEVLFGRQPNAIVYGANYVAFLRMVPGDGGEMPDQGKIKELQKELRGDSVNVEVPMTTTDDGITLKTEPTKVQWKFTSVSYVESHHFERVNVSEELEKFERWLTQNPPSSFKTKKSFVEAAQQFMLPIKEKFLDNVVRTLTPALRDVDVSPSEDIGVEGVVVLDPETGKQFKLVDKSVFTLINQFNFAIRNQIKSTSYFNPEKYQHLYQIFTASLGKDGSSVYGDMLQKIAEITGIPGLAHYTRIKPTIRKFDTPEDFIQAWKVQDVSQAKSQFSAAIREGLADLEQAKRKFDTEWKDYKLTLKSGREIQYTDEIRNRTLMVFAETKQELEQMLQDIQKSNTMAEIANGLFGKQLKAIR
jgi:hypothetical protein